MNNDELFAFFKVELNLAFYGCSPEQYFRRKNRSRFPSAGKGMKHSRYKQIISSLGKVKKRVSNGGSAGEPTWNAVFATNPDLVVMLRAVRDRCKSLIFVDALTILCLDDHHERLRNK